MKRPSFSLRIQLLLGGAFVLSTALLVFGVVAYQNSKTMAIEARTSRVRTTAGNLAMRARDQLQLLLRMLVRAADHPAVIEAARMGMETAEAKAVLESLHVESDPTVGLGLRNASNELIFAVTPSFPSWSFDPTQRADTAHFGRLMVKGDSVLYEVVAPVRDHGRVIGSLVRIRRLAGTRASIEVVADLIGSARGLYFGNQDGSVWTDVMQAVAGPPVSVGTSIERDGEKFRSVAAPIEGSPYQFAIMFSEDQALAPVFRLGWLYLGIGAAVLGAGLAAMWWMLTRATRPLDGLAQQADGMTSWYAAKATPVTRDRNEVRRLQSAFATMQASVRTAHEHLEREVAERGAALEQMKHLLAKVESSEEALRLADRRKDNFLATLAHELRNPLAPIRNGVHVVKLKGGSLPELQWATDLIERQMQHLTRLLDDLLDVSRITHDRLALQCRSVDLGSVLQQAIETSRPLIDAGRHHFTVVLPEQPVVCIGDPVRLAQVFSNLLNNSALHSNEGCSIHLAAEVRDGHAVVSVADNGAGIEPERLPRIFERFSQMRSNDDPTPVKGSGLGLGLSLVDGLVKLHGGSVSVTSAGLNHGSQFTVRLPLESTGMTVNSEADVPLDSAGSPAPHGFGESSTLTS